MNGDKSPFASWKEALDDLRRSLELWRQRLEKAGAFKHAEVRESWEAFFSDTAALQARFGELSGRGDVLAREAGAAVADAAKLRLYWLRVGRGLSSFGVDETVAAALDAMAQLQSGRRLEDGARAYGEGFVASLAERLAEALRGPEQELEAARRAREQAESLLADRRLMAEAGERELQAKRAELEAEKAGLASRQEALLAEERLGAAQAKAQAEAEHAAALAELGERLGRLDEQRRQAVERAQRADAERSEAQRRAQELAAQLEARAGADDGRLEIARLSSELERVNAELAAERLKVQKLTETLEASYRGEPGA